MDYLRGYNALRNDPEHGQKLLVGSLLIFSINIVPFVGQLIIAGWMQSALRRVVLERRQDLPPLAFDSSTFSSYFGPGFQVLLVRFAWALPLVAFIIVWGVAFALVSPLLATSRESSVNLVIVFMAGFGLLLLPIALMTQVFGRAAAIRVQLTAKLEEGFAFGAVWHMVQTIFGPLTTTTIASWFIYFFAFFLGSLLCCIGGYPALTYVAVMDMHIDAQLYDEHLRRGGMPISPPVVPQL